MADFYSLRFDKNVWITRHARLSMHKREIDEATLIALIEHGEIKQKNDLEIWIFMNVDSRLDNLICASVIDSAALIIKTVMINWELEDAP